MVSPLIVYVDDEYANRVVFEHGLKGDFSIETVAGAMEALELLARQDVAVLVTDIRMPQLDGLELLRIAKERYPHTLRMVITAFSDIDPILCAINEGLVARYIVKPWNRTELVQALRWATEMWSFSVTSEALFKRMLETERLASLGELTALYVHDLRAPLQAIDVILDELRVIAEAVPALHAAIEQAQLEPKVKARLLGKIENAAELVDDGKRAAELVAGMVGVMGQFIESGSTRSAIPVIDPLPIIRHAVAMYQRVTVMAAAQIDYRGPEQLPRVRIAPVDLAQVVLNLVANATQAVAARGVPNRAIGVHARSLEGLLELQVRDDGIGMSADVLERVGTPYFTTREAGRGLGIASCQRLVGSAGGSLRIESELGVGTTVTILLPAEA